MTSERRKRRVTPQVDTQEWASIEYELDKIELRKMKRFERLQLTIHRRGKEAIRGYIV